MSFWNKSQTTQLIMLYEQHPVLYNSNCEDAMDRIKKLDALRAITEELKVCRAEITQDEVKSKLKTLRSQFIREKNMIARSKKSGAGTSTVYIPKLWCFDELKFLDSFIKSTPSVSNITQISSPIEVNLEAESEEDIQQPNPDCNRGKKRKTGFEMQISRSLQVAEEMANNIRQKNQVKGTKAYNLGKFVEQELEDLPEDLFMESKWRIMDIIREVQEKNFMRKQHESMQQNTIHSQSIPTHTKTLTQNPSSTLHLNSQQTSQHEPIQQTPPFPVTLVTSHPQNNSPTFVTINSQTSTALQFPNTQNQIFQHTPITQTPKTSKVKTIYVTRMQPPK